MPTTTVRTLGLTNNASQLIAYSLHSFVLPAFGNGNADVERNVGFPGAPVTARGRLHSMASGSFRDAKLERPVSGAELRRLLVASRPYAAVELSGELSFNVQAQGRCSALSGCAPWSAALGN